MSVLEIILIIVCCLFVLGVIVKSIIDKKQGKSTCDCCDGHCSCCNKCNKSTIK